MTAAEILARIRAAVSPQPAPASSSPFAPRPGLQVPAQFYDSLRGGLLGASLSPPEVAGCAAILSACEGWPIAWAAYALATAYHETAHTMQPVKELGGAAYFTRMYDILGNRPDKARALGNLAPGDGPRYAGRGYVQLTGKTNYARAAEITGRPLVDDPDLALRDDVAAAILRDGMSRGWFTGRKLADCLPGRGEASRSQFAQARRIINGTDRADDIAAYALAFQDALQRGLWS